jgi:hypothetical protein
VTPTTHRAREILNVVRRAYPDAWRQHERFRAERGRGGLPDWPQDVYAPIAAAFAIASGGGTLPWDRLHHPAILAALAAWRMTQGIYRYDPALYAALVDTTIDGDVPNNALAHLPEWCVYVEMDGALSWGANPIRGFWAHLECDVARGDARELRLLLDTAESPALALDAARGLCPMPIVLGPGSLVDDIQRVIDSGKREAAARDLKLPAQTDSADSIAQALQPMLSLLLYLCSESPELSRRGEPGAPANPQPVHTRRSGWRVFPVDAPREWGVGVRIGAALRAAYAREQTGGNAAPAGHHVRPHVRRAHWHTILSGPRLRADGSAIPSSERQAALRWLPPIPVNVDDIDMLAATIHPVRR